MSSGADLTIDDDPPVLTVVSTEDTAEGLGAGGVRIAKTGGTNDGIPVVVSLSGSATPSLDYDPPGVSGDSMADPVRQRLLTIPTGPNGVFIPVDAVEDDDDDDESDETITLTVTADSKFVTTNVSGITATVLAYNVAQAKCDETSKEFATSTLLPDGADPRANVSRSG